MPTPLPAKAAPSVAAGVELDWAGACQAIVAGKKVTRASWNSADALLLHASVLHIRKADGSLHTLIVQEGDLVATDWIVVREH